MIACPICRAKTSVAETRSMDAAVRRRRRCTASGCSGKVLTVEVAVRTPEHLRAVMAQIEGGGL